MNRKQRLALAKRQKEQRKADSEKRVLEVMSRKFVMSGETPEMGAQIILDKIVRVSCCYLFLAHGLSHSARTTGLSLFVGGTAPYHVTRVPEIFPHE